MNAAFLLVTSALLVGQPGIAEKKPVPTPVVAPTPVAVGSSCCQDSCGNEGFGHRLRDKMRGLFNRNSCDSCQPTTCHTHHAPVCKPACEETCKPKWFAHCTHNHCAPATCNDSCERGGLNLFGKLRERFHRADSCCDSGCASGCASGGCSGTGAPSIIPGKTGEKIEGPAKKMPVDPPKEKKPQEVRIETQSAPFTPNVIQVTPTFPSVEITPVPAPRVEGDRRDPF